VGNTSISGEVATKDPLPLDVATNQQTAALLPLNQCELRHSEENKS